MPLARRSLDSLSRRARRVTSSWRRGPDDEQFLDDTFQSLLGRPVDPAGRAHFLKVLAAGASRDEIVAALEASDEYQNRIAARAFVLPDLQGSAPERYEVLTSDDGSSVSVFRADDEAAFDWIEQQIFDNGYYEKPGIWSFQIDLDKRVMAEMIAGLEPRSAVEVGCSSGAVLHCLAEAAVDVCGIEISELAADRAPDTVRDRIVLGDIGELEFDRGFDVAFGLDVFEHVHPQKLDAFIASLVALVEPGGILFVNVPAFGEDAVFGEVFPMFLEEWRADAANRQVFHHLQVDERGYPSHGHLVWATTDWWVTRFEQAGLQRASDVERALHDQYDWYFASCTPARQSFYVFTKDRDAADVRALASRIAARDSHVLADLRGELERSAAR